MAATCDAAIEQFKNGQLKKVTYISSSMVYESTNMWPSFEGDELDVPPPRSSYGFQKLAVEYWARAAYEQYGVPYTIVRPFNCVGVGEDAYMSHVVPDLARKILSGQDPLQIYGDGYQIRHYTYGGDLARGIVMAMEHPAALCQSFNLSSSVSTTVLELAHLIWRKINKNKPFRHITLPAFEHDVACRIPDTYKAETILGFKAETSLEEMVDITIEAIRKEQDNSYPMA
jgi:nucleoside-diphosphate-sugar epimerase